AANGGSLPSRTWRKRGSRRGRTSNSAWKTSNAISAKWRRSPSSRQTLRRTRPGIWLHRVLPVSARRRIACAISSDCCKARTAGCAGGLLLAHNWADWAATKRSYELMARHVHPHFQRNANALRDWSYADAKSKYETAGAQSQAAVQAAIDKHQRRKA